MFQRHGALNDGSGGLGLAVQTSPLSSVLLLGPGVPSVASGFPSSGSGPGGDPTFDNPLFSGGSRDGSGSPHAVVVEGGSGVFGESGHGLGVAGSATPSTLGLYFSKRPTAITKPGRSPLTARAQPGKLTFRPLAVGSGARAGAAATGGGSGSQAASPSVTPVGLAAPAVDGSREGPEGAGSPPEPSTATMGASE